MSTSPLESVEREAGGQMSCVNGLMQAQVYRNIREEVTTTTSGVGLIGLSHIPVIRLSGPDVQRWCNGMFTNNIRRLHPGQGNRSAMCDDRGRVQGLIDLYCVEPTTFFATLEGVTSEWFEKRYNMFLVLDDIECTQEDLVVVSIQGPHCQNSLSRLGLTPPSVDHDHIEQTFADTTVRIIRKDRSGLGGFDIFVEPDHAPLLWQRLRKTGAEPLGHASLNGLRIIAGLARWPDDGTEVSMVHELLLDGECCAFDKGCYVGQEVINRLDVKGGIKKRLTLLRVDSDTPPPSGAAVIVDDKKVGRVSSVTVIGADIYALAVLRISALKGDATAVSIVNGTDVSSARAHQLPLATPLQR